MELTTAYLCLGSNIKPKKNLALAVQSFKHDFEHCLVSSVYQTPAEGFDGNNFLNLAIEIKTEFSLAKLLAYANTLEQNAGRVRVKRGNFDARTLDVDIVIFGDLVGTHEGRVWPAEDLTEFGHVLKPLAEIAPTSKEPLNNKTFQQLWNQFEKKGEFEIVSQRHSFDWLFT